MLSPFCSSTVEYEPLRRTLTFEASSTFTVQLAVRASFPAIVLIEIVLSASASNGEYQYYYYENLNADLSQQFEKVKWDTWSICSIEELVNTDEEEEDVKTIYQVTSNVWTLGLNMEEPTISQNINVSSWYTLGQYPKFSMG